MFTKADVSTTILGLAKSRYGVPIIIQKGATFESLKFDKYDVLYLVMACEEHFGIHIAQEEIMNIPSVHALITVVCSKLNELGQLDTTKKKHVETVEEKEAKEAMEDAKSNDGVPVGKTEGDFEREEIEAEQSEKLPDPPEEISIPAATVDPGQVITQPMSDTPTELPPEIAIAKPDDTVSVCIDEPDK